MFKGFAYYRCRTETITESTPAETLPGSDISQRWRKLNFKGKLEYLLGNGRTGQALINQCLMKACHVGSVRLTKLTLGQQRVKGLEGPKKSCPAKTDRFDCSGNICI